MRDGCGKYVPKRLEAIFAGRQLLVEWSRDLEIMRQRLLAMEGEPFIRDVQTRRIARMLESARTLIVLGSPMTQCDCPLEERDCPKCKGSRWLTAAAHLMAGDVACKPKST